jgi:hypothetical protein
MKRSVKVAHSYYIICFRQMAGNLYIEIKLINKKYRLSCILSKNNRLKIKPEKPNYMIGQSLFELLSSLLNKIAFNQNKDFHLLKT